MINLNLLIFPFNLDTAKDFAVKAKAMNLHVIGASSEVTNTQHTLVDEFIHLPFITDPSFNDIFYTSLKKHQITHVYAPHGGVWIHIKSLQTDNPTRSPFHLCTPAPFEADWQEYAASYDWATGTMTDELAERISTAEPIRKKLTLGQYAGLHKQFTKTPGQCDDEKLLSLTAIAQVLPKGDIVEIGVLYGRSANALGWLAKRYDIGSVICVDPWQLEEMEDQGENAAILNSKSIEIDSKKVFKVFIANAVLLNNIGYIRKHSVDAITDYERAKKEGYLESEHLDNVTISGDISLLHVDGSHKYEEVWKDIKTWEPHIIPGGWLLLDDYVWTFGSGPQKVGDELLTMGNFDTAFCLGDTLFLRKK